MAKAFLLRWGYQNDFDSIKLQTRELGFAVDTEKIYIGTDDSNVHLPNEGFVSTMITTGVALYKPTSGTTLELATTHLAGTIGYDTDEKRLKFKSLTGTIISLAKTTEIPVGDATSVVVAIENIDAGDNNSVLLTGYVRPVRLVFLNGILCTNNVADPHQYIVSEVNSTIKIKECAVNDIIAYF